MARRTTPPQTSAVPASLTSACPACARPVVWGTCDDGTRVALDTAPRTYVLLVDGDRARAVRSRAYVAHDATCPAVQGGRRNPQTRKADA